jgi:voltage-gated potassium channel Kch
MRPDKNNHQDRRVFGVILKSIRQFACSSIGEWKLIGTLWSEKFPNPEDRYPLSLLERTFMTVLVGLRTVSLVRFKDLFSTYEVRSALSEMYTVAWFFALIFLLVRPLSSATITILIVAYRIIDATNYRLCILFVGRYQSDWSLRSLNRSLILLLINYLELIVAFAVLYLQTESIGAEKMAVTDWGQALYFSLVTISTLGYGDFTPLRPAGEWLVVAETILGFVLVVLVIGAFLPGLRELKKCPPTKDDP